MSDTEDNQPEQVPFQDQLLFGKHDLGMAAHWALALSPSTKQLLTPDCATKVSITINAMVPTLDIVFNKHETIDGVKQNIVSRLSIDSGACKLLDFKKIDLPAFKVKKTDFKWPRGAVGISIEVTFDAECVTDSRFFMGGQSWINSVRETVISEQKLLLWLAGGDSTMDDISKLQQEFHQDSTQVNLKKMFPPGQGRIVIQEGKFLAKDELDKIAANAHDYRYKVPTNFHSKDHMAIEMCMAGLFARNEAEGKRSVYVETPKDMKIIKLPSVFEESYLAFLPAPADDQTRLAPGDKLMIWFDIEDPDPSNDDAWHARVAEPIPDAPAILVPIHMDRPWDKKSGESGAWKDNRELTTIDLSSLPADQPYASVMQHPGMPVKVKIVDSDMEWKHMINNLDNLMQKDEKPELFPGIMIENDLRLVMGTRLDKLDRYDAFEHLRAVDANFLEAMDLNTAQKSVIAAGRSTPGNLLLAEGGPGTGKTKFAVEVFKAHAKQKDNYQVVFLAPSNENVTDAATKFDQALKDLQKQGLAAGKFVVRLHSKIREQNAKLDRGRPVNARPKQTDGLSEDQKTLIKEIEYARLIHEHYEKSMMNNVDLVDDHRVTQESFDLSLGVRVLQYIDVLPNGPKARDLSGYSGAREIYEQYRAAETYDDFPESEKKRMGAIFGRIRHEVIKEASAICSTVTNAAQFSVVKAIEESARLVILDEAARVSRFATLSIFLINFQNQVGKILVGDANQLGIISMTTRQKNPFALLCTSSHMASFIHAGFDIHKFNVQYRMSPPIAKITTKLIYKDAIINDPSTACDQGGFRADVIKFNGQKWGVKDAVVFHDIPNTSTARTSLSVGRTRYNSFYLAYGINIALACLERFPDKTIGFLCGYKGHTALANSAKVKMVANKLPNAENFVPLTVDQSQGKQFDIVILSLLVCGGFGFQDDTHHQNVAWSRARGAIHFLASSKAINESSQPNKPNAVKTFKDAVKFARKTDIDGDKLPECPYFKSDQVDLYRLNDGRVDPTEFDEDAGTASDTWGPASVTNVSSSSDTTWGSGTVSNTSAPTTDNDWSSQAATTAITGYDTFGPALDDKTSAPTSLPSALPSDTDTSDNVSIKSSSSAVTVRYSPSDMYESSTNDDIRDETPDDDPSQDAFDQERRDMVEGFGNDMLPTPPSHMARPVNDANTVVDLSVGHSEFQQDRHQYVTSDSSVLNKEQAFQYLSMVKVRGVHTREERLDAAHTLLKHFQSVLSTSNAVLEKINCILGIFAISDKFKDADIVKTEEMYHYASDTPSVKISNLDILTPLLKQYFPTVLAEAVELYKSLKEGVDPSTERAASPETQGDAKSDSEGAPDFNAENEVDSDAEDRVFFDAEEEDTSAVEAGKDDEPKAVGFDAAAQPDSFW